MYVIKRNDQGRGYVSCPGSKHSYTKVLTNAQVFTNKEYAEHNCCGNEYVVSVDDILRKNIT